MSMRKWNYTKGLHDLGNGCYAYLQPNGGWGWSKIMNRRVVIVSIAFSRARGREIHSSEGKFGLPSFP